LHTRTAATAPMRSQGGGDTNVSSIAGLRASSRFAPYSAS
jgi:hypothetical protein